MEDSQKLDLILELLGKMDFRIASIESRIVSIENRIEVAERRLMLIELDISSLNAKVGELIKWTMMDKRDNPFLNTKIATA